MLKIKLLFKVKEDKKFKIKVLLTYSFRHYRKVIYVDISITF